MVILISENEYYTQEFLQEKLGCNYEEILTYCDTQRILQYNDANRTVSFQFVGFLFFNTISIAFLPKYLNNIEQLNQKAYTSLLMHVLHKYQKGMLETDYDDEILEEEDKKFHLLGTISYLFQYYINHGLYIKEHDVQDTHFVGEIDWQATIGENTGYLTSDNKPVYLDLIKNYSDVCLNAKITDLHKFILNQCSMVVSSNQLDLIFSWPQLHFDTIYSWENNLTEAIYIIEQEMLVEFQDQKLHLLKNLKLFIEQIQSMQFTKEKFLFGSKYFYHVWEKCCSDVLGHDSTIQQHISKPIWQIDNDEFYSEKTLKPDFLKTYMFNNSNYLLIFDAKYYNMDYNVQHSNVMKSAPGIADITKQYMYQKSLKQYATNNAISTIYNAFLIPTTEEGNFVKGSVQLDFMSELPSIKLIYLNAELLFSHYIKNEYWNTNYLDGLLNELQST